MKRAVSLVACAGASWALLCAWLAAAGYEPSVTLVPIPRSHYYAAQAVFVVPLVLLQWLVLSVIAHAAARALGGGGDRRETAVRLAPAFAWPLMAVLVVPDAIVLAAAGFEHLGALVRITTPLLAVVTWIASARAVRRVHALSVPRATLASFAGLIAQAGLGAPFLR